MNIQLLKQISIPQYLQSLGFEPAHKQGGQLVYHSPKTSERTPSFYVHLAKNVFNDFSGNEKGDIIRMVQYLHDCNFNQALKILDIFCPLATATAPPTFSFSGKPATQNTDSSIEILAINPLQNKALISYVESRKIQLATARNYLQEVTFNCYDKRFFAVGFENDLGGFELRNQFFKGGTKPKTITIYTVQASKAVCVFEGFFDFLSALEYFQKPYPKFTTIILNSLSNLNKALPLIQQTETVYTFFDNDEKGTGQKATQRLIKEGCNVSDQSNIYAGFKDFNEFLIKKPP